LLDTYRTGVVALKSENTQHITCRTNLLPIKGKCGS